MDKGAEIYRRFLDGDDEALGKIVDLYREGLILFIYRYVANLADAVKGREFVIRCGLVIRREFVKWRE